MAVQLVYYLYIVILSMVVTDRSYWMRYILCTLPSTGGRLWPGLHYGFKRSVPVARFVVIYILTASVICYKVDM